MRGARLLPPVRSVAIGNGWSSNTVNTAIFRHHGILTFGRYQFLSHYEDRHTLAVVRRDLASDDLEWGRIAGDYELADAHNVSCLGADPDGHLHISYDHHNSRPKYRRSLHPLSVQAWSEEAAMTGKPEERVTYPTFIMNVGDGADRRLVFAYRSGSHDCGEIRLKRYDHAAAVWSDDAQPILSGLGGPWTAGPYLNHPCVDGDGRLHISFVWRTALLQPGAIVNNRNLSCAVSPDGGRTWLTARGFRLAPPLTPVTAETIFAHPCGANLMNQNGMALDSKGEPHIAFFADDDHGIVQYYHCWRAGSRWNSSVVSARELHSRCRETGRCRSRSAGRRS